MPKKFPEKYVIQKRGKLYWYPRPYIFEGSPFKNTRLPQDYYEAMAKAKTYNNELVGWLENKTLPPANEGSINWLIAKYKSSEGFGNLADSNQKTTAKYLDKLAEKLGTIEAKRIEPKHAYRFYEKMREEYPDKSRTVQGIIAAVRAMFSFGRRIGANHENPFTALRISKNPPRNFVWTQGEVQQFIDYAISKGYRSIALAVRMATDLGQRQGDILTIRWNQFDEKSFTIKQSKTGAIVKVPCTTELLKMVLETKKNSNHIIVSEATKQPYKSDYFQHTFRDLLDSSGVRKELQFLDLRRTCVVRLAEAGCSLAEISAISGHSIETCQGIMEVYLPRNSKMAENAVKKLEGVNNPKSRNDKN